VRSYTTLIGGSKHRRRCLWAALAPVAAALIAGCGGSDKPEPPGEVATNVVQAGAPGEVSRKLSKDELAEIETVKHTKADVAFVKAKIHHHGQALLMTNWVPRRTASRDIDLMAERMKLSQRSEIELMQRWLKDRGIEPPGPQDHQGHDHGSRKGLPPGMLTSAELGRLFSAKGRRFDRLFLRYMTYHHRGAITMIEELHAGNGGLEPELDMLNRHVEADQEIEISRMQQLLAARRR
jgi:uncharacterized protein (DUF305 family)